MKEKATLRRRRPKKVLIKKCHVCGQLIESYYEISRCPNCKKSFLPSNYLEKKESISIKSYNLYFSNTDELCEDDLIKGIHVLW